MDKTRKLLFIKIIHTAIWIFFVTIIFYVIFCGLTGRINGYTWIAISLVILEGAVLLVFGNHCPLTVIARKYSASKKHNFDIFLPEWLAKYNKLIFTGLFIAGLLLVIARQLGK